QRPIAVGVGRRYVEGVAAAGVAEYLGINRRAARYCLVHAFQYDHAHALAEDEPFAVQVEGARGAFGTVVEARRQARIAEKPARAPGWISPSTPPAIMTSAAPRRMNSVASPSDWVPVAQAATTVLIGPREIGRAHV